MLVDLGDLDSGFVDIVGRLAERAGTLPGNADAPAFAELPIRATTRAAQKQRRSLGTHYKP